MSAMAVTKRRVLVVDDEENVTHLVSSALRFDGFDTVTADNGQSALVSVAENDPDLVILDVMMPGMDGLGVLQNLRAAGSQVPVIFLTARDAATDRIGGLRAGADDYVVKPFSPRELAARVKAIIRRADGPPPDRPPVLAAGTVEVDTARREARVDGRAVQLATREFDLLAHFARNRGLVLSRQQLLDAVWGVDWYGDERTVDVHVGQLRKKLGGALAITTVWGVGYRLD